MRPFFALLRKHIHDTLGTLGLSAAALFALGWLFVFVTSLNETKILKALSSETEDTRFRWLRNMGLAEKPQSVSIMMSFWSHPFILLIISVWAIGRGSIAVGAEGGTGHARSDPLASGLRISYLFTHVLMAYLALCC